MLTHSNAIWTFEMPVSDELIKEVIHILMANKEFNTTGGFFVPEFKPIGQIDRLVHDIAYIIDYQGFSGDAIREYAWRQGDGAKKALVLLNQIRGTLILIGELIAEEDTKNE